MESLLQSKLGIPRLPDRRIGRERPDELLRAAQNARLILVSAPPGFGKTTTLVEWVHSTGVSCGWVSLDESDNDPVRFLRYLWVAAASTRSNSAETSGSSPDVSGISPGDVVAEVAVALAAADGPVVLVLDDYHFIEAPEVHRAVALLLDRLPPQAHLVISTRVDPPLALARMRARAELVEVRADSLRFTTDEAGRFLAERMGVELAPEDLATLVDRAEGWPAALQLAGLSLAGAADPPRFVRDFAGTNRFILDFISEEVLAHLAPADNEFLLRTCVLDRLTGELCDAVTGQSDGRATLERLERANMLIVPLDDERRWFRYHRLFADLLRARQSRLHPEELPALHARAADWFEANGFARDAIDHAIASGDIERIRAVFPRQLRGFMFAGEFATVRGWLDRMPAEVARTVSNYSIYRAFLQVLTGQKEGVAAHLDAAAKASAGSAPEFRDMYPSSVEAVLAFLSRLEGDLPGAIRHAERAAELVPDDLPERDRDTLMGLANLARAEALLAAGELAPALEVYQDARPHLLRIGLRIAIARFASRAARIELDRGRPEAALGLCDMALVDWAADDPTDQPASASIYLARAEALEALNDADAVRVASQALELATCGGDLATLHAARGLVERLQTEPAGQSSARPTPADRAAPTPARTLTEPLTEREIEVLRLVAAGHSNRQIGSELFLALGTVKAHTHTIYGKLGAANRVQAITLARDYGLI